MVLARCSGICFRCGRKPKSEAGMQVHHEEYAPDLRNVPTAKLKGVCQKCHDKLKELAPPRPTGIAYPVELADP